MKRKQVIILALQLSFAVGTGLAIGQYATDTLDKHLDKELTEQRQNESHSACAGVIEYTSNLLSQSAPPITEGTDVIPVAAVEETEETEKAEEVQQSAETLQDDYTDYESQLLLKLAMAEAENQDIEGKALVICVVRNRIDSEDFPDTIEEVIYQENQFTPILDGRFDAAIPNEDCYTALDMVLNGWDKSGGATYFEVTSDDDTWHSTHLDKLYEHQDTTFYIQGE